MDSAAVDRLVVTGKASAAEGVAILELARPDGRRLPDWTPGAHIDVTLGNGETRQYSLCGDRWDAHRYRVAVLREVDGRGGSAYVHDELAAGDEVTLGGPRNNFAMVPSARYVFVAGGIGITPLLPMITQAERVGAEWTLLYGGRRRASMAFLDDLARYGERVRVVPQDEAGLLPLASWLGGPRTDTVVYCCGPAPLLAAVEQTVAAAGWAPHRLRTERFTAAEVGAPVRDAPFTVELARTGTSVTVTPQISVLAAARDAGATTLSSCEKGTCGTCETTVLDGVPDHRDSILADHERAAGDCMFPCVSRSCTDRLVLDL
ncbi:PDR/VanB family oxidoreductase [Actinomycetospora chibensis]|uniref:PDR/VanB family oxidoreductase n=1 Tax=Actinomycetospora chibensis TaxID=663606 RepID=A0ABV9RG91_9PSEU|nr:PDR/VanB family oxidoreductase [Actinomycetospora chibensis]MDD7926746.1 PDR/VanB family oxidoreductase [Actinomycetospora chibensis]